MSDEPDRWHGRLREQQDTHWPRGSSWRSLEPRASNLLEQQAVITPNDTGSGSRDMFHGCARAGAANERNVKTSIVARMFARIALRL